MKVGKNLLVIGLLVIGMSGFLVAGNWLTPSQDNVILISSPSFSPTFSTGGSGKTYFSNDVSYGYTDLSHHSIDTKMSLQGKVTDFNGNLIDDANLEVTISDTNSCTTNVFYDYAFPYLIQDGYFNTLLGQDQVLRLNFNQDYYMCLIVNNELLSGPQVFRGGQGEVNSNALGDGNITNPLTVNYFRVRKDLEVDENANLLGPVNIGPGGCGKIYWDDVNGSLTIQVTC